MTRSKNLAFTGLAALFISSSLSGCAVAKATGKIAALPVKGVYNTAKYAGKGAIGTTNLAAKSIMWTGKGFVKTGETIVHVTNGALTTTANVLTVTSQVIDVSGKIITVSTDIPAYQLKSTIAAAKASAQVISILVDIAS